MNNPLQLSKQTEETIKINSAKWIYKFYKFINNSDIIPIIPKWENDLLLSPKPALWIRICKNIFYLGLAVQIYNLSRNYSQVSHHRKEIWNLLLIGPFAKKVIFLNWKSKKSTYHSHWSNLFIEHITEKNNFIYNHNTFAFNDTGAHF